MNDLLLTSKEAAAYLDITVESLRQYKAAKKIKPKKKVGKFWLWERVELDRYKSNHQL